MWEGRGRRRLHKRHAHQPHHHHRCHPPLLASLRWVALVVSELQQQQQAHRHGVLRATSCRRRSWRYLASRFSRTVRAVTD